MTITRLAYDQYLEALAEVRLMEDRMRPHAVLVVRAFIQDEPENLVFRDHEVEFTVGSGTGRVTCAMPLEYLLDPNWKGAITAYHVKKMLAHEAWRQKCEAEKARTIEEHERAELARLLGKYGAPVTK